MTQNTEDTLRSEIADLKEKLVEADKNVERARTRDALARKAANIGYWDFTPETGDLQWSSEMLPLMSGMQAGEIDTSYENFTKFIHPDDVDECNRIIFEAIESREQFGIEYRVIHKDGSLHWINGWGGTVEDIDGKHRMIGAAREITHHKETEEKLSEKIKEMDFQKFALDEHAIVSMANKDGKIIYANEKFCAISGYTQGELIGNDHNILNSNEHPPEFFGDLWRTITKGRVWIGEIKNKTKFGDYYWVKSTIVPFLDDNGKPFQYTAIRTDITVRKDAEKNLKSIQGQIQVQNQVLEKRVIARTQELVTAKEVAVLANKSKTIFLANMSHELRTPLNAIIGFSTLMRDNVFGPLGHEKYDEYMNDINDAGEHLLAVLSNILDIAHIESGYLELNLDEMNLLDEISACISMVKERAKNANITISNECNPDIPAIMADRTRLKQIFLNLLSNCIKYAPNGTLAILADMEPGGFFVAVSDTGMGISENDIERVMHPFTQSRKSSTVTHEGVGLGLHLAKKFTEAHGGILSLTSVLGKGTTVSLHFPENLFKT